MKTLVANSLTRDWKDEGRYQGKSTMKKAFAQPLRFLFSARSLILQFILLSLIGGLGTAVNAAEPPDKYGGILKNDPFTQTVDLSGQGLMLPLKVTSEGLPPGITAAAVAGKPEITISGTPTVTGAYKGTITVTDSSRPPKEVKISGVNFFVGGSRFRAKVEILVVPLVPKPFVALYDSGAPNTILKMGDAVTAGLIGAGGKDNGFQAGNLNIGGIGGAKLTLAFSRPVTVNAKGLKADGMTDYDPKFASAPNRQVVYPVMGQADPKVTLLGTDFLAGLGGGAGAGQFNDGSLTLLLKQKSGAPQPAGLDGCAVTIPIGGLPPSWTLSPVGNTFITTGSPFTVVSQYAAEMLGMDVIGQVDLYHDDPITFQALFLDGFFDDVDPGPITIIKASFSVPGTSVTFTDVPVLVNPFSAQNNSLSGTDLLSLPGGQDNNDGSLTEMLLNPDGSTLGLGCEGQPLN